MRQCRFPDSIPLALTARYVTFVLMVLMALFHERVPAVPLHDSLLEHIPYSAVIDRYNYLIWLVCYIPLAALLWKKNRAKFIRFLWLGALLSLLRGLTIQFFPFGPVHGEDINAGLHYGQLLNAWIGIINPFSALSGDTPALYLTKDLFFSGHTSTTFLLLLFLRSERQLFLWAVAAHTVVIATVLLSHLHYTIDIVGAWIITLALFLLCRQREYLPESGSG